MNVGKHNLNGKIHLICCVCMCAFNVYISNYTDNLVLFVIISNYRYIPLRGAYKLIILSVRAVQTIQNHIVGKYGLTIGIVFRTIPHDIYFIYTFIYINAYNISILFVEYQSILFYIKFILVYRCLMLSRSFIPTLSAYYMLR